MDTKYQDYLGIFFTRNPYLKEILLPHNHTINKYTFLQKTYPLLTFSGEYLKNNFNLMFDCTNNVLSQVVEENMFDCDMQELYDQITSKISEQKNNFVVNSRFTFKVILETLIQISVLFENIYLADRSNENTIKYKVSSFSIDHILAIIEMKCHIGGIQFGPDLLTGMIEDMKGVYNNFSNNMNQFIEQFKYKYDEHASFGFSREYKLDEIKKTFLMLYFEILLLTANTYNEYIKEQYSNGKW